MEFADPFNTIMDQEKITATDPLNGLTIVNPKKHAEIAKIDRRLFPYYAGYSADFAKLLLQSAVLPKESVVLDPWNGSGTTIHAAHRLGAKGLGFDLNPSMVVVAKAGLLSPREAPSLLPLAEWTVEHLAEYQGSEVAKDPLEKWFYRDSAICIRALEGTINKALVSHEHYQALTTADSLNALSSLAAFFYVALFRSVRRLLTTFIPTNPTWVKHPRVSQARKRPYEQTICAAFLSEVENLASTLKALDEPILDEALTTVSLGNSECLKLPEASVDFILASPPYCTRIDYAMATAIELAIMRFDEASFTSLRRSLMGTSTVDANADAVQGDWGLTCSTFLDNVYSHPSKASKGYYYKNHVQYFRSLRNSIHELSRVIRRGGQCVLVVQDSHYKDIHNDVPAIVIEMAAHASLMVRRRQDFAVGHSMVQINKRARKYLKKRVDFESVICLAKE